MQGREGDTVRYSLLESIRDFALERLAEAAELDAAGRTHASYYLALAERAEPELTGRGQRTWFLRLERAHENLRAALRWLFDHDEGERALRLATALGYFWEARGYMAEGRRQLDEALTSWEDVQHAWGIAYTLLYLGAIELMQEHREEAVRLLEESLTGYREIGDESARGLALLWRAGAIAERGEILRAAILLQELLELSSQAQDRRLMHLCAAGVAVSGDPFERGLRRVD